MSLSFLRMACVCLGLACSAMAANADPAALVKAGHFKQARIVLEKRLADNPKDADALVLLARVRLAYGEYESALKLLQQALDADPKNSDAHVYLAEAYSQKVDHVNVFEKSGMAWKIKNESESALASDPRNIDAMETLLEFHLEAPGMVGGDKSKAKDLAEKIAALDAVRGFFAQADIAAKEKHYDEQEKFLLKAVAADPQSYDALTKAAGLYLKDRWLNYGKAAEYARKAVAVDATRAKAYVLFAKALAAQEQWTDLEPLLVKAEKDVPDDLEPYYAAGREMIVIGRRPERAETYFRKYLTQEPEGEAPSLAEAHWQLGLALEKQGRKPEAIAEIQVALKLKPGLKEAQKDLKRIKG